MSLYADQHCPTYEEIYRHGKLVVSLPTELQLTEGDNRDDWWFLYAIPVRYGTGASLELWWINHRQERALPLKGSNEHMTIPVEQLTEVRDAETEADPRDGSGVEGPQDTCTDWAMPW